VCIRFGILGVSLKNSLPCSFGLGRLSLLFEYDRRLSRVITARYGLGDVPSGQSDNQQTNKQSRSQWLIPFHLQCILARLDRHRQHPQSGVQIKENGAPGIARRAKVESDSLEHQLPAQLQCTWAIVARDLAEVGVVVVHVDALGICMVEGVERLKAQIEMHPFAGCEGDGFEQ